MKMIKVKPIEPKENYEAIQITEENIFEIVNFVGGIYFSETKHRPKRIEMDMHGCMPNETAIVGDWVLVTHYESDDRGLKSACNFYKNDYFTEHFSKETL